MTGEWVAIDGGQSAVRVRLSWSDEVFIGPGFSHGAGRVDELIAAVLAATGPVDARPTATVAMGHTGLPVVEAERAQIAAALAREFRAARVLLVPDMVTAHVGALAGGPGVVISGGTGAVCLGVAADGAIARVDGWGYLFGDAGSAFAIGREALDAAMRHVDGREHSPAIHTAAAEFFGADLRRVTWDLYAERSVADLVARFAPRIVQLARDGDPRATSIVSAAVDELVASVVSAAASIHSSPDVAVSYTGGLFGSADVVDAFVRGVSSALPRADIRVPAGDPLAGAVHLARRGTGIHSPVVHSYRGIS